MSGLRCLDNSMVVELEAFLAGTPLASIQSLVGGEDLGHQPHSAVDACLDLLESLWAAQALKERHFDSWMADLQRVHAREVRHPRNKYCEKCTVT